MSLAEITKATSWFLGRIEHCERAIATMNHTRPTWSGTDINHVRELMKERDLWTQLANEARTYLAARTTAAAQQHTLLDVPQERP